jgi:hypothetical protein
MDSSNATQLLPPLSRVDPQAQMLEDMWLLTIFAALLATAFPWFVNAFNIDFASASWALLTLGGIFVAMSLVGNLKPQAASLRGPALALLHLAGVIAMAVLWQRSGGLQNPLFLLAFVLPVIGASALSRWQPYVTAAVAVLVVAAVAMGQAPELRWYAAGRWLMRLVGSGAHGAGANSPFLGFYAPVGYDLVLLEVFAILLFAIAVAAESLRNGFERLLDHLSVARADATRGQEMWAALLQQLPLPALLIDAETLQIVLASEHLEPFCSVDAAPAGQGLFEAVQFSYPEPVQALIVGNGGTAAAVAVRRGDALRMAEIRVRHIVYERRRLALVVLQDVTSAYCVTAALDVDEHAVVMIDARGRVIASNRHAQTLFPDAKTGSDASGILLRPENTRPLAAVQGATRWWEPGLSGRRRMRVTLGRRAFQATCTAVALPGEKEVMYVAALAPVLVPVNGGLAGDTVTEPVLSKPR